MIPGNWACWDQFDDVERWKWWESAGREASRGLGWALRFLWSTWLLTQTSGSQLCGNNVMSCNSSNVGLSVWSETLYPYIIYLLELCGSHSALQIPRTKHAARKPSINNSITFSWLTCLFWRWIEWDWVLNHHIYLEIGFFNNFQIVLTVGTRCKVPVSLHLYIWLTFLVLEKPKLFLMISTI